MPTLTVKMPEPLAKESQQAAENLGMTRSAFIRQALEHELANIRADQERQHMAASFRAMAASPDYMRESEMLDQGLGDSLPEEADWWR